MFNRCHENCKLSQNFHQKITFHQAKITLFTNKSPRSYLTGLLMPQAFVATETKIEAMFY